MGIEVVRFSSGFRDLAAACAKKDPDPANVARILDKLKAGAADFYRNYQPAIDRQVMAVMLKEMSEGFDPAYRPEILAAIRKTYGDDFDAFASVLSGPHCSPIRQGSMSSSVLSGLPGRGRWKRTPHTN